MSDKKEMTKRQETAAKALRLDFYIRALRTVEELYNKHSLYERIKNRTDESVTTIIDALRNYTNTTKWGMYDSSDIDLLFEHITKKYEKAREDLNYWFVESTLPFMDWHDVIRAVRGRMAEGKNFEGKEKTMFCAMLAYQNAWIEKFVLANV